MKADRGRPVRSERGHIMLELAASAGVLMATLAGSFQFGYSFYVYNELVTAIGNGARYASQRTYRGATPEDLERGRLAIRNMVVFGNPHPAPDAKPVAPDLKPEQVRVEWVMSEGVPAAVDVSIGEYRVNGIFGTVDLKNRPSVEFPYLGRFAPSEHEP
jgi:hypothetical protein